MLKRIIIDFKKSVELKRRIKFRHKTFWKDEIAEEIRNVKMSAKDSLQKWQDIIHWQRKLSNKLNAREFARMHGCRVPDLYWKGRDIHNINFSGLPSNFVIRPTVGHSSKLVFVMANGTNLFDNKQYSPLQITQLLSEALSENENLEFLIEEFLKNENGQYGILTDYKFFCFNGEIATIMVINRLSPNSGFASFYDEHWNEMETVQMNYPQAETQKAPLCLADMVSCVKKLSKAYGIFVRIDFYATYKGCVFGEFTPTPSMGTKFTRYGKEQLLNYWDTYCKGLI
ncbi:ATP-grasp fold amidoligase family protein [Mucilaginibacter sp.]|jgi:hypothetical protein|uniref:ATP-grasp fold amidoligase family protein n=1 Tax=Mucilaginibacter sp. TaxID=1882438 RepID=UPI00356AAB6B